jgi:hypothetical protein
MPVKHLVQIIQWLPTKSVFKIMSVSRDVEAACRQVIEERDTLELVHAYHMPAKWRAGYFTITVYPVSYTRNEKRLDKMSSSLKQMKSLKYFVDQTHIHECECDVNHRNFFDDLRKQNASTLKQVMCHQLPDDGSVCYPLLDELHCQVFDVGKAARLCPNLQSLTFYCWISGSESITGNDYPPLRYLKQVTAWTRMQGMAEFLQTNAASLESITYIQIPACSFPKVKHLTTKYLPAETDSLLPSLECLIADYIHEDRILLTSVRVTVSQRNLEAESSVSLSDGDHVFAHPPIVYDLPVEKLVQVIHWLPTQFIFTIMSVSKDWQSACHKVIETRTSLEVACNYPAPTNSTNKESKFFTITMRRSWDRERLQRMASSLMLMKSLVIFKDQSCPGHLLSPVLMCNASKLKQVSCHQLPDYGSTVYPLLEQLDCYVFDESTASRLCPRLQTLAVHDTRYATHKVILGTDSPNLTPETFHKPLLLPIRARGQGIPETACCNTGIGNNCK